MTIFSPTSVAAGQSREFDVDGRAVTVICTDEAYVLSEQGRAQIIRQLPSGEFAVVGVSGEVRSEPSSFDGAIRFALDRLRVLRAEDAS